MAVDPWHASHVMARLLAKPRCAQPVDRGLRLGLQW